MDEQALRNAVSRLLSCVEIDGAVYRRQRDLGEAIARGSLTVEKLSAHWRDGGYFAGRTCVMNTLYSTILRPKMGYRRRFRPSVECAMIPIVAEEVTSVDVVDSSALLSPDVIQESDIEVGVPDNYDEVSYLEAYPDIAKAVRSGDWTSGLHHYRVHGAREDRLADKRYLRALSGCTATFPPANADRASITKAGHCLVSGWSVRHADERPDTADHGAPERLSAGSDNQHRALPAQRCGGEWPAGCAWSVWVLGARRPGTG